MYLSWLWLVTFFSISLIFVMNKHNQKPIEMFNKQDVIVYLSYIEILKN